jgi:hypothetical protein
VKLAEKSDDLVVAWNREKSQGVKGIMKMKTMKSEQLAMEFADGPKGGQNDETLALTREESTRLYKASDKEFEDFMAATAEPSQLMERIAG